MTWEDWHSAVALLAEERTGAASRAAERAEDQQVEATKAAIRRTLPRTQQQATPVVIPPRPITDEIVGV